MQSTDKNDDKVATVENLTSCDVRQQRPPCLPLLSSKFCCDGARTSAASLHVSWPVRTSRAAGAVSTEHVVLMHCRAVYPSATLILSGADICKHPLGSGQTENGSDCCRVFGESRSEIFIVQNSPMQNGSNVAVTSLFHVMNQSGFTHWRCAVLIEVGMSPGK